MGTEITGWNIHWQTFFSDVDGLQYAVYIYERDYAGVPVEITAAAHPFVTQEDRDNNIFKPIRRQTGYLRLLDEEGTLLEYIMPKNNTSSLVILYSGRYDDGDVFSPTAVEWQGFLCAQAYTQPWNGQTKILEIPIKSLLTAMEDVEISESDAGKFGRFSTLFVNGMASLVGSDNVPYEDIVVVDTINQMSQRWMYGNIEWRTFFNEANINNEGDNYTQIIGMPYYDILSAFFAFYGVTAREQGNHLFVVNYDEPDNCYLPRRYSWEFVLKIANEGYKTAGQDTGAYTVDMLDSVTFDGANNNVTFNLGSKAVVVQLSVGDRLAPSVNLPQATEDNSQVDEIEVYKNRTVYVQAHEPVVESKYSFSFYEYSVWDYIGKSDYQRTLENSWLRNGVTNPYASSDTHLYTGAFPVRWFYRREASDIVQLKNGLLLQQQYRLQKQVGNPSRNYCFTADTIIAFNFSKGYINIDFNLYNFIWNPYNNRRYFGDAQEYGVDGKTEILCALSVGNKMWNGTEWIDSTDPLEVNFWITFDGVNIKTNKTEDMLINADTGYFIPVEDKMNGNIKFYILNVAYTYEQVAYSKISYSRIISDLNIQYLKSNDITVSERGSNNYRKQILTSGFSGEKTLSLKVGTFNNNRPSSVFVCDDDGKYIELLYYMTANGLTKQRPELHLLGRMERYYSVVRRTFTAQLFDDDIDLMTTRYILDGRKYMALGVNHDWSDKRQDVQFTEVTNDNEQR